ncbi:ATP-binding protein [Vibrio alginolyticus]|uniref:AAA family ATPase n=1 Tax=Vibrio harveyi group TaxID=717610 RepID=UPI001D94B03A|nr:ATP-binding protein [Vibrio alginolyticus]ELA7356068.1 ATP-binding protein [Vibrio alginolyticus]ELA8348537.1 ATP-binding protein [Vibrio alginolyticus]MCG6239150.1 ATP-binding protein [Vibrio diabolicus]
MEIDLKQLHVKKIEILNLWGKEEISIPFKNRVTFLTGINGTGKSSILNVLFDSLNPTPQSLGKPATSKYRFWSSELTLINDSQIATLIIPQIEGNSTIFEEIDELIDNRHFHDIELLRQAQSLYESIGDDVTSAFLSYESKNTGEMWKKSYRNSEDIFQDSSDSHEFIDSLSSKKPLAFLFQEDRLSMHNLKNYDIETNTMFWNVYSSSIDERFAYCRSAVQAREAHLNKLFVQEINRVKGEGDKDFLDKLMASKSYLSIARQQKELDDVLDKINEYFEATNKRIARDAYDKITLANVLNNGEEELISWQLLSRGEKTLIYLFLSVYYYKDRVAVFLLDEPEISFHVKWQKNLIRDLSNIAPDNQFIITTHSPSLVKNGWLHNCLELTI